MSEGPREGGGFSIRSLAGHTSIYAIAPLFQRVLAVVLVSLYTRKLGTDEWGILGLTDLLLGLLPIIVGTSLVAGLSRHYFVHEDPGDRSSVVAGVLVATASASVLIALGVLAGRHGIAGWLFEDEIAAGADPGIYGTFVAICAGIFPLALVSTIGIETLQLEKRSKAVVKITVAKTLLEAALKLWFLFGLELGVSGVLLAILIGEAVFALGLGAFVVRRHGVRPRWRTFRPLVNYSLPLIPVSAFQLGLHQADKLMIKKLGSQEIVRVAPDGSPVTAALADLGVYSFGYQIPFLLHLAAMSSFMRIWTPSLFGARDDAGRAREVLRIGTGVVLLIALGQTIVGVFAREGVVLLASQEEYYPAARVIPWISAGYVAYAAFALGQAALMTVFATRTLALLNGGALALNLGLNAILIPRFGIHGAAAATLVSFTALALGTARGASRQGLAPFRASVLPAAGVVLGAGAWLASLVDDRFPAWDLRALALKATLGAGAALALLALAPPESRARVIGLLRRR